MNAIINKPAKNIFKGFKFFVVQRTISTQNANSLGRFEQVGGGKFVEQYIYNDVFVDGGDYLNNVSRYASEHREVNKNSNVVYFVVDENYITIM